MSTEANAASLHRAREAWNRGDTAAYLAFYAAACVIHNPPGDLRGSEAIRQYYEGWWAAFPGSQLTFEDTFAAGDRAVARFTVRGPHAGAFMGIPATGREITVPGITIFRFAGGTCVERWNHADFLGLLQQLGAIPTPGQGAP